MKRQAITIITILYTTICFGQQQQQLGVNIKVYDPISKFSENVGKSTPAGISVNYLRSKEESRYSFGGEFGVAMYSSNDYMLNYQGQNIEVNEEDCFWTIHGLIRYDIYRTDNLVTYAEARAGLTTFFSSTTPLEGNTGYKGAFEFHGTAFNTGLGAGIHYRVGSNIWLNAGANLHSGSKVGYRYMPESDQSVSLSDGQYKSLTHYVGYRLGVSFDL
jgi:hypothetical protein